MVRDATGPAHRNTVRFAQPVRFEALLGCDRIIPVEDTIVVQQRSRRKHRNARTSRNVHVSLWNSTLSKVRRVILRAGIVRFDPGISTSHRGRSSPTNRRQAARNSTKTSPTGIKRSKHRMEARMVVSVMAAMTVSRGGRAGKSQLHAGSCRRGQIGRTLLLLLLLLGMILLW